MTNKIFRAYRQITQLLQRYFVARVRRFMQYLWNAPVVRSYLASVRKNWLIHLIVYSVLAVVFFYSYTELFKDQIILEVISVPKDLEDKGITSKVLAGRLRDETAKLISESAETFPGEYEKTYDGTDHQLNPSDPRFTHENSPCSGSYSGELTTEEKEVGNTELFSDSGSDSGPAFHLEIADTSFSPQAFIIWLRDIGIGKPATRVEIELVEYPKGFELQGRAVMHRKNTERIVIKSDIDDFCDDDLKKMAEHLLRVVDPVTYIFYLEHTDRDKMRTLIQPYLAETTGMDHAKLLNLEGNILSDENRLEEARVVYSQAKYPHYYAPDLNEARIFHLEGYYDEAIKELRGILYIYPIYEFENRSIPPTLRALAHNNLAAVYDDEKRYTEAIEEYKKAITYEDDPRFYANLGLAYGELKEYDEAIRNYSAAKDIAPGYAYTYVYWAEDLYAKGQLDEANEIINEGFKASNTSDIYKMWADFLDGHGQPSEKNTIIEQGLANEHISDKSELLLALGDYYRANSRCPEAVKQYDMVPQSSREYGLAQTAKADCISIGGDHTGAEKSLNELIKSGDCYTKPLAYIVLGQVYQRAHQDIKELLERGIRQCPSADRLYRDLGVYYENRSHYADAQKYYSRALELLPKSALYHTDLGDVYREQKQFANAKSEYEKALEIDPSFADALTGLHKLSAEGSGH